MFTTTRSKLLLFLGHAMNKRLRQTHIFPIVKECGTIIYKLYKQFTIIHFYLIIVYIFIGAMLFLLSSTWLIFTCFICEPSFLWVCVKLLLLTLFYFNIMFVNDYVKGSKSKKRKLRKIFKTNIKEISYMQYLIYIFSNVLLVFITFYTIHTNSFNWAWLFISYNGISLIMGFLAYNILFTPKGDSILSIYNKYKGGQWRKAIPNLKVLIIKFFLVVIFLYIIRSLFLPGINDAITYFFMVLSISPFIYFFINFIKNYIKYYNVCSIYQINSKSLKDTSEIFSPSKIILSVLSVVLISIIKSYLIEIFFIIYDKGLKIKIPLLEYNIIDKKNIINFFIKNRQNFTKLNLTRINFLDLLKSLFNLSIKFYIWDIHFNKVAKSGIHFNTPPRTYSPILINSTENSAISISSRENSAISISSRENSIDQHRYQSRNAQSPTLTDIELLEKVEEIRRNIREQYPDDVRWVNYNMNWLSLILRNHEYRDTNAGYDAFNVLVHLALGRTLVHHNSTFGAVAYESREAKKVLSLIPDLPFFLDKLIDNLGDEYKGKVIARYKWLIEEVNSIKPSLTPEERKLFTYKPCGENIPYPWAVGSLNAEQRMWFTNAIRNGTQLNFNIEYNPRFPNNLRRGTDLMYSNSFYTKYGYNSPHGQGDRILYWYEIRDPYLSWYNNFNPNGRTNGILAYHLSKILEDRLRCGFRSFYDVMDDRLVNWCASAINHGIERRGVSFSGRTSPAAVITQESITILKYWLA